MNCRDYEDAPSLFQAADSPLLGASLPLDLRGFCGCSRELPDEEETVCTLCGNKDADLVVPDMTGQSCEVIATLALFVTDHVHCMQATRPLKQLCCNVTESEVLKQIPTSVPSVLSATMYPTQREPPVGRHGSGASTMSFCAFKALILVAAL
jgi:hypothetical protein